MHMFVLCYVLSWSWLISLISLRVISLSPGNLITFQCQGISRETNKNICHRDPLKPDNITTVNRNTTKVNAYSMECTVISPGKVSMMTSSMEKIPRYWPFVLRIHRSPVNSPLKGQWRGALMFSLIRAWINGWVNDREAGDLIRHRAHYDVIIMKFEYWPEWHSL